MTKILLANVNSLWGVIINPHSSNAYRHILSFDNETLKDDFINKNLFNGKDYKKLIEKQPNISYTLITSTTAVFRVNIKDYPKETIMSLLNKDFAIIKDNDKFYYYTLVGTRVGNIIEYTADIDIFFTYDIKNMFNDKPSKIVSAHEDRFYKNKNNDINPTIGEKYRFKTALYNSENFDNIDQEALIATELKPEFVKFKYNNIFNNNRSISETEKNDLSETMDLFTFASISVGVQDNDSVKELKGNNDDRVNLKKQTKTNPYFNNGVTMSYATLIGEGNFEKDIADFENNITIQITTDLNLRKSVLANRSSNLMPISNKQTKWADVIKTSYQILPLSIFQLIEFIQKNTSTPICKLIKRKDGHGYNFNILPNIPKTTFYNPLEIREVEIYSEKVYCFIIKDILSTDSFNDFVKNSTIKPFPSKLFNISLNKNKIVKNKHNYEIKSYFAPYRNIIVKSITKNSFNLLPQYFFTNELKISASNIFMPEQWGYNLIINNYYSFNRHQWNNDTKLGKSFFEDQAPYSLPTEISAWDEFISRNKAQQASQMLSKTLGLTGGILSGLSGASPLGYLGAAAGVLSINQQLAMRKDIRNTPNTIKGSGSTFINDFINKNTQPEIFDLTLNEIDLLLIKEHFYKYGYNHKLKLMNINNLLKSRYYFNYIEISETFENIKMQLSGEIKQLINDTISNGVTIWHIRDLKTFKGIKNYDYENVEMSCI